MVLLIILVASNVFAAEIASVFRYPVGDENGNGWLNDNGLKWLNEYNYEGNCGWVYHPGIDFNKDGTDHDGDIRQPVYATANGEVIKSYYENKNGSTWGNLILIRHVLPNGELVFSLYGHLDARMVFDGNSVTYGQQIGTVGKGIGLDAHLHFEIRKENMSGYNASYFPCGQTQDFVEQYYFNPEAFITSHQSTTNLVGKYPDSSLSQPILSAYTTSANNGHPLGSPRDNNGGGVYVHNWNGVTLQDFYGTNTGFYHGYTSIIVSSDGISAYLLKEGFWDYYMNNNGPATFGPPFTDEITAEYADSPFINSGDYMQAGQQMVVQKFKRIGTDDRRTLVYNKTSGQPATHFAVGEFSIGKDRSADGVQWYVTVDSNPANDKPWPKAGVKTPTGKWFTKAITGEQRYNFVRYNSVGRDMIMFDFCAIFS